jgi:hypothetical protein
MFDSSAQGNFIARNNKIAEYTYSEKRKTLFI